jgi:hypothetical protein
MRKARPKHRHSKTLERIISRCLGPHRKKRRTDSQSIESSKTDPRFTTLQKIAETKAFDLKELMKFED